MEMKLKFEIKEEFYADQVVSDQFFECQTQFQFWSIKTANYWECVSSSVAYIEIDCANSTASWGLIWISALAVQGGNCSVDGACLLDASKTSLYREMRLQSRCIFDGNWIYQKRKHNDTQIRSWIFSISPYLFLQPPLKMRESCTTRFLQIIRRTSDRRNKLINLL